MSSQEDATIPERPEHFRANSPINVVMAKDPTDDLGAVYGAPKQDIVEDILMEAAAVATRRSCWQPVDWKPHAHLIEGDRSCTVGKAPS